MKKFVLNKSTETMAIIMAGAMLFGNSQPFLPEETFIYSVVESQEEVFTRKRNRKKKNYELLPSGKYSGYTRKPRNGFGRPNTF